MSEKAKDKPAEKTKATRVYPVTDHEGNVQYVDASSEAEAIKHIYHPKVGRPLSGTEVARVYQDGGKVQKAS